MAPITQAVSDAAMAPIRKLRETLAKAGAIGILMFVLLSWFVGIVLQALGVEVPGILRIPIWLGEIGAWRGLTNVGLPILLIVILLVWFFKEFRLVWITGPNWAIIRLFGFNIWNGRLLGFMFRLEPVITVWKQSGSYTPIERLTDVVNLDTLAVTFIASGNVRPAENWHHRRIYARKIGLYAASDASTTTWVMAQTKIQIKTVIQAAAAGYRPERLLQQGGMNELTNLVNTNPRYLRLAKRLVYEEFGILLDRTFKLTDLILPDDIARERAQGLAAQYEVAPHVLYSSNKRTELRAANPDMSDEQVEALVVRYYQNWVLARQDQSGGGGQGAVAGGGGVLQVRHLPEE